MTSPTPSARAPFWKRRAAKPWPSWYRAGWKIKHFNELRLLPGLKFEGEWDNDPLHARQAILELVSQIPENRWWSLSAFVAAVQRTAPRFSAPGRRL